MSREKLPKTFGGARVVRGLGMKYDAFEKLRETHSLDSWDATQTTYVVVPDRIDDGYTHVEVAYFLDEAKAIRYARALSCGNVDHRVLTITDQVLVVATDNDL